MRLRRVTVRRDPIIPPPTKLASQTLPTVNTGLTGKLGKGKRIAEMTKWEAVALDFRGTSRCGLSQRW